MKTYLKEVLEMSAAEEFLPEQGVELTDANVHDVVGDSVERIVTRAEELLAHSSPYHVVVDPTDATVTQRGIRVAQGRIASPQRVRIRVADLTILGLDAAEMIVTSYVTVYDDGRVVVTERERTNFGEKTRLRATMSPGREGEGGTYAATEAIDTEPLGWQGWVQRQLGKLLDRAGVIYAGQQYGGLRAARKGLDALAKVDLALSAELRRVSARPADNPA